MTYAPSGSELLREIDRCRPEIAELDALLLSAEISGVLRTPIKGRFLGHV
jgi:hypothetical protein